MASHSREHAMSHSEALEKVCAVCCNLNGTKACRVIGDKEETILKTHIFPLYRKNNDFFPQEICKRCIHHLTDVKYHEHFAPHLLKSALVDGVILQG